MSVSVSPFFQPVCLAKSPSERIKSLIFAALLIIFFLRRWKATAMFVGSRVWRGWTVGAAAKCLPKPLTRERKSVRASRSHSVSSAFLRSKKRRELCASSSFMQSRIFPLGARSRLCTLSFVAFRGARRRRSVCTHVHACVAILIWKRSLEN